MSALHPSRLIPFLRGMAAQDRTETAEFSRPAARRAPSWFDRDLGSPLSRNSSIVPIAGKTIPEMG